MTRRSNAVRSAIVTVRDLVGGLLMGAALGAMIDGIGKSAPTTARVFAILVAGTAVGIGVRTWGHDIARLDGGRDSGAAGWTTALALAPVIIVIAAALGMLEPVMVERGARSGLAIHVVYTLLFVAATLLIAGVGAFALGSMMHGAAFGFRLAGVAGVAAAAGFLAVVLVMNALGWQVGAPDAGRRATMVVVTSLGLIAAASAAGGAIGAMLPRPTVAMS
jgi:F0F1-type ATP synthase assembly protein I